MSLVSSLKGVLSRFGRFIQAPVVVPDKSPRRPGVVFVTYGSTGGNRLQFETIPIDLTEVEKAYNVDSYVRRAVDKHIELMFKSGWDIVGSNEKARSYVVQRLATMGVVMRQPTESFLIEVSENLVKYANAFIVKVRGGPEYLMGLKAAPALGASQPVVGYTCLSPLTVEIARDKSGVVRAYRQNVPEVSSTPVTFKPIDVIHIFYRRETGYAFGTPFIWPVLEDVKLLRQVEELVAKLIYKELFPFIHWKVGLEKEGYEGDDAEVQAVRNMIAQMAEDGILVTTERHNIDVKGAEGQALDAEKYLRYFEQRVFTGLGVSETQMGRAGTASRSTAEDQTEQMYDTVKALQSVLQIFIDFFIIYELLFEGGFNPLSNPKDEVHFRFREIDLTSQFKRENSAIYKFEHNATTWDEMREELGREIEVDESRLKYYLMPALPGATAETDNRQQPANQYGSKPAASRPRNAVDGSDLGSEV